MRWQLRKSAPFPIDEAVLTCAPGAKAADGAASSSWCWPAEMSCVSTRAVCEEAGMHAGLVDLSTLGVVNLCLASGPVAGGRLAGRARPAGLHVAGHHAGRAT